MVDGQENPTVWIAAYGLDKLSKVLTYTGHNHFTATTIANKRFFDGLGAEDKPIGSFLFTGPSGVGKTLLANSL